jgi:4-amino-4-deoxy-L-arabinose transferase-like glycosyltransferase
MITLLKPRYLAVFGILLILALFLKNEYYSFWDQDEAAYAGFALRMNKTGNYLIPDFTWSEPHRKTPLHFWSIAMSFKVFGANEFATRVPSALAMLLSVIVLYSFARKSLGRDIAGTAAIIMASSLIISLGKVSVTDAGLLLFETISILSIWNYIQGGKWKWLIWLWVGCSLGLLIKGPPIYIVCFGILGLTFLFTKQKLRAFIAGLVSISAVLPLFIWGRMAWQLDGGTYIQWMIDWYILKRTSGTVFGQTGPPGYYFAVFILVLLPWLPFFFKALTESIRNAFSKSRRTQFDVFVLCWFVTGWWFYEALPSKLPAYAIAAFPGICLVMARTILRTEDGKSNFKGIIFWGWMLQSLLFIGIAIALWIGLAPILASGWRLFAYLLAILCLLSPILFYQILSKKDNPKVQVLMPLFGFFFVIYVWNFILPGIEEPRSATKKLAYYLADQNKVKNKEVIITSDFSLPSLPFYLEQKNVVYREVQDSSRIDSLFRSGSTFRFVFNQENIESFLKRTGKQMIIHPIEGMVSDQGLPITYMVLEN